MTTSIVPANEMTVIDSKVSVASYQAMQSLMTGRVPANAIKTHSGKGGQELMYASHIHGTKTMNEAFSQLWDMEVLRETVYADNSATAAVQVTIHFFDKDTGTLFHSRKVTELGSREQIKGMPIANVVLGAASRGLMRCMLRLFNYGAEFYKNEEEDFTDAQAWNSLKHYAKEVRGLPEAKLIEYIKENGIKREDLVDRFFEVYKAIHDMSLDYAREEAERKETELKQKAVAQAEERAAKAVAEADLARKALEV